VSRYALLILPSANRVYAAASTALTTAELRLFGEAVLDGRITDVAEHTLGGVPYVTFTAPALSDRDVAHLSNLSTVYALFEVVDDELLRPLAMVPLDRYPDDLITIQKYAGKTNEQFTKLLLNVTALSSAYAAELLDRPLRVLDPLCGRGTTLNQALMYGFDAAGIELDRTDVEAYSAFIQRWLKDKRLKHKAAYVPVRREKKLVARRLQVTIGGSPPQDLDVVNVDTTRATEFFRRATFDLVVADLPYGVQHGSRTAGRGLARGPLDLLAEAAPGWTALLRPGGAMGLSWNTFVAKREAAEEVLAGAGLTVLPDLGFAHRVDQAIRRDIVVARKPDQPATTARDASASAR